MAQAIAYFQRCAVAFVDEMLSEARSKLLEGTRGSGTSTPLYSVAIATAELSLTGA